MLERIGDLDYRLRLPWGRHRIHPVFHVDKLFPHRGNEVNRERPEEPGPIELEDEGAVGEYEVEKILNSLQYEVKWEGWDEGHISWGPAANIGNAKELVAEFHREHPDAVGESDVPQKRRKKKSRR